ncbi:MAG: tetratricopeptide repeat protein [Planctomycetota bacterium]|nr:tetratricopeptide repeat protein [Planctomycetota bacterium]
MRISHTLLALALAAAPIVSTHAESVIEKQRPHAVELAQLVEQPTAYLGMRVRFLATFVQTSAMFDTFHTGFTPGQYMNIVIWDDDANIWDPEVRAAPVMNLYYEKKRAGSRTVSALAKYTVIQVTGEVVSDFRGTPWINVHEVVPLEQLGSLSDNGVYHVQRGVQLAGDQAYDLADENYATALEENLPLEARITVLKLRAQNQLNAMQWKTGAEILKEAVTVSKGEDAAVHYMLARALGEMAEDKLDAGMDSAPLFTEAVTHARAAVSIEPEMGDAYAVLGISLAGLEQFDEAKQQCERAIRLLPDNAEVRWYLGRILNRQGDYEQAIAVLKEAIDRAPKDYRLHKTIGRSYFERGLKGGATATSDVETALREYDIAIRLNPEDADLHHYSGLVLEHATDRGQEVRIGLKRVAATYDMAVERFQAALAVDDTYTEAHVRLGARFRHVERHAEAVDHYKRALELEPERDELYGLLGQYLWDLDRRDEAYVVYVGHNERNPDYIDTLYALGRLSLELDEDERAIEWLNKLLRVAPEHAKAHADLSESYMEISDFRRSVEHADKALELLEDEAAEIRVHQMAGLSQWGMDKPAETIASLDGRIAETTDVRLPLALGWALSTTPDAGAAVVGHGTAALAIAPDNAEARELQAWGQYLSGNFAGAEATITPLVEAKPEDAVYAFRLGMAMFQQGPDRYAAAAPVLEIGAGASGRRSTLGDARSEARSALSAIRDYNKQVARDQAAAAKDAERKRREAAKQAEIEKREAQKAEKKRAEEQRRMDAEKKKAAEKNK